MASLVFKAGSYYGIFSRGKKKKWLKIGRVDKKQAAKMLRQLELEYNKDRLNLNLPINLTLDQYLEKYFKYTKTNKAIELDPKDTDAYSNRGVAKLILGQKDSGCLDFSKAGELGYAKAYEAIKEFCN